MEKYEQNEENNSSYNVSSDDPGICNERRKYFR